MTELEQAKFAFAAEALEAERRFIARVGPLKVKDDDLHLTRWATVWQLRSEGMKFREIGLLFGFTAQQARTLYEKANAIMTAKRAFPEVKYEFMPTELTPAKEGSMSELTERVLLGHYREEIRKNWPKPAA